MDCTHILLNDFVEVDQNNLMPHLISQFVRPQSEESRQQAFHLNETSLPWSCCFNVASVKHNAAASSVYCFAIIYPCYTLYYFKIPIRSRKVFMITYNT